MASSTFVHSPQLSPSTTISSGETSSPLSTQERAFYAEASQAEITLLLQDLGKRGDIAPIPLVHAGDDDIDPDDLGDSLADDEAEISMDDEDALPPDESPEPPNNDFTPIRGNGELAADALPTANDDTGLVLRIRITDGKATCRFNGIHGLAANARTPRSQIILDCLRDRQQILDALAQWLEVHRQRFLLSGDPWDLGENAPNETKEHFVPVIANTTNDAKRTFLWNILSPRKEKPINAITFSRYISHVRLVWDDGQCGLKETLFGDDAKRAWAAQACLQRCKEYGASLPQCLDDADRNLKNSLEECCSLAGVKYDSKLVEFARQHTTGALQ